MKFYKSTIETCGPEFGATVLLGRCSVTLVLYCGYRMVMLGLHWGECA